jgi:hypothetical protein
VKAFAALPRLLRGGGLSAFALAAVAFAAGLAGGRPIWTSALIALVVVTVGMGVVAISQSPGAASDEPGGVSTARQGGRLGAVHIRAAAFAAHVLMAVIVGAFVVDQARGVIDQGPWLQLGGVALVAYLAGMLWFSRRR